MRRGRWDLLLGILLLAVGGCATVQSRQPRQARWTSSRPGELPWAIGNPPSPSPMSGPIRSRWATRWTCAPALWRTSGARFPDLQVQWVPVTVESRIPALLNGTIDLECGSTTKTLARQEQVDFSLTTFLTGGSLLTLVEAPVGAELRNLRIAVIPRTTTEQVLKTAVTQSGAAVQFVAVADHAAGLAALEQQSADAYASDRIILIGLALAAPNPARFALADRYFSYEPYALMLRQGDPAFRLPSTGCWRGCTARVRFSRSTITGWPARHAQCSPAQLVHDRGRAR